MSWIINLVISLRQMPQAIQIISHVTIRQKLPWLTTPLRDRRKTMHFPLDKHSINDWMYGRVYGYSRRTTVSYHPVTMNEGDDPG